jgi:hypothetical protein
MSQTKEIDRTGGDREDVHTQEEEEEVEEDSLSEASTVYTVSENSSKLDIKVLLAIIQTSQRRMEKIDSFVKLFVRVASRISTMSTEEMEANRRLNMKNIHE